jgi:hypothetical protein
MLSSGGLAKTSVNRIASTPNSGQLRTQVDAVAQRLAHLAAVVDHLALGQVGRERLEK